MPERLLPKGIRASLSFPPCFPDAAGSTGTGQFGITRGQSHVVLVKCVWDMVTATTTTAGCWDGVKGEEWKQNPYGGHKLWKMQSLSPSCPTEASA